MRILLVQYAGDYRAAHDRLQATGDETYYGHRYILEQLVRLQTLGDVAVMCCLSPERYEAHLPNGLTVIGAHAHPQRESAAVKQLLERWNPTHLIVFGPLPSVIRWGITNGRRVICVMADSFGVPWAQRLVRYGRLSKVLNHTKVEWVANHGVNACRSLMQIGVDPRKVIAWDYPYARTPGDLSPRELAQHELRTLLYVGAIQTAKGLGDALEALSIVNRRGLAVQLHVAGDGQIERFRRQAKKLEIVDKVEFLGSIPNSEVFDRMRVVDAVVIPSRREYPEGLPLTIYEALCARTPVIASNHPMFAGHLVDGETASVFPAGKSRPMADKIEQLFSEPGLYSRLSQNSTVAWERMQNPMKWGELIYRWVRDTEQDRGWLTDAQQWTQGRTAS